MTVTVRRTPPKLPRPYPAPLVPSPVIADLERRLGQVLPEKWGAVVADFWRTHAQRPVLTPTDCSRPITTFLWRDHEAVEVLLFVNRMTDEQALADSLMWRVPGTDVWWLAFSMDPDWRASYAFLPRRAAEPAPWVSGDQLRIRQALDRGLSDPANPVSCRNRAGILQSVVELPAAPAQRWLPGPHDHRRASTEEVVGPGGRRLWVDQPPELTAEAPVILALDGDVWNGRPGQSTQDLPGTLANLTIAGLLPPALTIMIDSGGRDQRWRDLDPASRIGDHLADDLLPWARRRYGVRADPDRVVVVGQSLGGLVALSAGITHPHAVGRVVAQSASLWQDDLRAALGSRRLPGSRFDIQVGRQEWVLRRPNLVLARSLRAAGADVSVAVHNGGHDYAWWRGGVADGLLRTLGSASG